jgi:hypothetical protein
MKTAPKLGSILGSARASRAGDGALAIVNFSETIFSASLLKSDDCGAAPQSAREARALPRIRALRFLWSTVLVSAYALIGCETSNYAPPVTQQMVPRTSRRQHIDSSASLRTSLAELEHGRNLFVHRCIECHTLPPMWKYSRGDWPQIVNDMSHRASLKPEERDAVVAYILAVRSSER